MQNETLSFGEQIVFDVIVDFIAKNKCPPTIRELCQLTGYRSTATIQAKLKSLKEKGFIETASYKKRTIIIKTTPADIVSVVRCEDCKYYERPNLEEDNYFCIAEHTNKLFSPNKNDYCSYGERKDENGNL